MSDSELSFVLLTLFALVAIGLMRKWQLLKLPQEASRPLDKLVLMSPLIGFLLFLGSCAFVPGWIAKLIHYTDTHGISSFSRQEQESFSLLVALVTASLLLIGFNRLHAKEVRASIWGTKATFIAIGKGVLYCFLCYPVVMALVQGIHLGLEWFGQKPYQEQVALAQLKAIAHYPWLFWSYALAVVTLVPFVEEFLFRGLFQNYVERYLGTKFSIVLTSILFALFHFSQEQGSTNIELMLGLFLYSCFIGIFYCKERSLWTPLAMHATFNAITLFFMFFVLP